VLEGAAEPVQLGDDQLVAVAADLSVSARRRGPSRVLRSAPVREHLPSDRPPTNKAPHSTGWPVQIAIVENPEISPILLRNHTGNMSSSWPHLN
jgi:hypothetical protein